jgi:hypothetical protein
MKRYLNLLLLVVLGTLLGAGCAGCLSKSFGVVPPIVKQELRIKLSNSELIAMEGGSTVALMGYRDDKETTVTTGYRPYCTGVWVDDKHILTANHCVDGELEWQQDRLDKRKEGDKEKPKTLQELLQRLFGGGGLQEADKVEKKGLKIHYIVEKEVMGVAAEPSGWHLSKVVAWDEPHDLALLEVQGQLQPPHTIARLAKETPELGEHVNVVGHQTGLYWTYMSGQVAAYRDADHYKRLSAGRDDAKGPYMQVQIPIFYGNSGGGCFNDYGELVGITIRLARAPEVGIHVHLDTIRSFLDKHNSEEHFK